MITLDCHTEAGFPYLLELERALTGSPWDFEPNKLELWPDGELDSAGGRVKLWRGPEWDWVWWKGGVAEMGAAIRERVRT